MLVGRCAATANLVTHHRPQSSGSSSARCCRRCLPRPVDDPCHRTKVVVPHATGEAAGRSDAEFTWSNTNAALAKVRHTAGSACCGFGSSGTGARRWKPARPAAAVRRRPGRGSKASGRVRSGGRAAGTRNGGRCPLLREGVSDGASRLWRRASPADVPTRFRGGTMSTDGGYRSIPNPAEDTEGCSGHLWVSTRCTER